MRAVHWPHRQEEIDAVIDWLAQRLSEFSGWSHQTAYAAAILDADRIIGAVAYTGMSDNNIEMHIATDDKQWCSRKILRQVFWYPFHYLGLGRITAISQKQNPKAHRMLDRLGFKREGELENFYAENSSAIVWRMLRQECLWLAKE
jgi:RimJ/RimL family protein N-acetyltransferase